MLIADGHQTAEE